jgi:hypothetical protein
MLATILEGVGTIGCTSCTCTLTCSYVLLYALLFPSCIQTVLDPSFRFEVEAWPVRRHGVTITMLLLAVIALPSIDAGIIAFATTTSPYGRVLSTYTPLTDSNIKTAAQLWVFDEASATSTYGLVHTWDLSEVTNMEQSKSIRISENDLT